MNVVVISGDEQSSRESKPVGRTEVKSESGRHSRCAYA
jgi:hypothetical protein